MPPADPAVRHPAAQHPSRNRFQYLPHYPLLCLRNGRGDPSRAGTACPPAPRRRIVKSQVLPEKITRRYGRSSQAKVRNVEAIMNPIREIGSALVQAKRKRCSKPPFSHPRGNRRLRWRSRTTGMARRVTQRISPGIPNSAPTWTHVLCGAVHRMPTPGASSTSRSDSVHSALLKLLMPTPKTGRTSCNQSHASSLHGGRWERSNCSRSSD